MREQIELLKHHADLLAQASQVCAGGIQVFVIDLNHPVVNGLQPVQGSEQGTLARAAAANDSDHLALFDRQVDAFEHVVVAVVFMQGGNSKQRHAVSFPDSAH